MTTAAPQTAGERVRLARVAEDTLRASTRVDPTTGPDGRWVTADGGRLIRGVGAVAEPSGRFELVLHANVRWPTGSLESLAEQLRERICHEAEAAGLGNVLGPVGIWFHDLIEPTADQEAP